MYQLQADPKASHPLLPSPWSYPRRYMPSG
jgi:hypothetical protein